MTACSAPPCCSAATTPGLSHLCVRKLTRKRGVGRRLLEETQRQASEAGKPLRLAAPAGHLEASALAARTHLPLDPL